MTVICTILQGLPCLRYHPWEPTTTSSLYLNVAKSCRSRKNIYMTSNALQLKKLKNTLWQRCASSNDSVDIARFKLCRNKLRQLTRQLRKRFEAQLVSDIKVNPKAFWKYSNSRLKTKPKMAAASASVWGSVKQAETSLDDVMSEQMAMDLQKKEDALVVTATCQPVTVTAVELLSEPPRPVDAELQISSDLLLAQLMQDELDRESDMLLQIEERKANRGSKVSVSFENYRLSHPYPVLEPDEVEEDYPDDVDRTRDWDSFESRERDDPHIPHCGYTVHNDRLVTKHDSRIAGRKNACKVMDLPPSICTGDGGSFDMEVNNGVLNGLRRHARSVGQRRHRVRDKEDRSTSGALDRHTRLMILKMVNSGVLEDVNGSISTGKEATVFHAWGGRPEEGDGQTAADILDLEVPEECVLKVFKTTLNEFKTREKYIKNDMRFKDRISKQNPRKMIHLWAEKEMCNLKRLTKAGIRCPQPLLLKQHVLLMSFVGEQRRPAPKLKDVLLTEKQWREAYRQVLEMAKSMYEKCGLVHADLSEYNILYHAGACWFIDVSQSVEPFHPDALMFLHRDCVNITNFFSGKGVSVLSAEEMFSHVSGLPLTPGTDFSLQITELEKSEQLRRRGQRRSDEAALQQCMEEAADEPATGPRH